MSNRSQEFKKLLKGYVVTAASLADDVSSSLMAKHVAEVTRNLDMAIHEFLGSWHYVTFDEDQWSMEHSFACRLAGTLSSCEYNEAVRDLISGTNLGRWRITDIDSNGQVSLEPSPEIHNAR